MFEQAFKNIDDVLWKEAGCTTELDYTDIQDKDRVDVVLTNPPFGGKERKEVQQNFSIRTGETAFMFFTIFQKYLYQEQAAA